MAFGTLSWHGRFGGRSCSASPSRASCRLGCQDRRIEDALSGSGPKPLALATGLGVASSSCSYAAIAIAKSLLQKGASATTSLAFPFASTNLVWELGLVLWVLIGWRLTLAEYIGALVMIALMAVLLRVFVSPRLEAQAREHAQQADMGHQHHMAGERVAGGGG